MKVILLITATIYLVQACELKCSRTEIICTPGQPLRLNHCQSCRCAPNGHEPGVCTRNACVYPPGKDPRNCIVGKSWKENCNSCCCIQNIGTVCTANTC